MADTNNINDLISDLQSLNEKTSKKLVLPHSKIEVQLKKPQARHISKINTSLLSSASQFQKKTLFNDLVESMLKDLLSLPDDKSYADFSVFDYFYILFSLREHINPKLHVETDEVKTTVDVTDSLKKFVKNKFKNVEKAVGNKSCRVRLSVPSYKLLRHYEKLVTSRQTEEEKKGEKNYDFEAVMKDVFIFSILQYIDSISLQDSDPIEFTGLTLSQRVQVLENIPSDTYKAIVEGIKELNTPIDELLKTDIEDVQIPMDHSFLADFEPTI